jgi:hypothetical protein
MTNAFGLPEGWVSLSSQTEEKPWKMPQEPLPEAARELFEGWVDHGNPDGPHQVRTQKDFIDALCDELFPYVSPSSTSWIYPAMTIILDSVVRPNYSEAGYYALSRRVPLTEEMELILHALMGALPCMEWGTSIRGMWVESQYEDAWKAAWEALEVVDYTKGNTND